MKYHKHNTTILCLLLATMIILFKPEEAPGHKYKVLKAHKMKLKREVKPIKPNKLAYLHRKWRNKSCN